MIALIAAFSTKEGGRLAQHQRMAYHVAAEPDLVATAPMAAGAGMNDLSRVANEMFEHPVAMAKGQRK
jgi:hypothetical protein